MIVTILLTVIIYLILQRIDDNRRETKNQPPASIGSRMGLLFFVAIVCYVIVFLLGNMNSESSNKLMYVEGGKYETDMLKNIHEPIHTGTPPF